MYCRICGETVGLAWRERSRLTLCNACHKETPAKCSYAEFLEVTGLPISDPITSEFWSDYKVSEYSDPKTYWNACSL